MVRAKEYLFDLQRPFQVDPSASEVSLFFEGPTQVLKVSQEARKSDRPAYVTPRVQVMSEKDILNTFQVTQAMQTWWTTGC